MTLLSFILCTCFALRILAAPYSSFVSRSDNASITPGINATIDIKDRDGLDVTSSFQVMIYQQAKALHSNNLNDRYIFSRPMIECTNSTFLTSFCTPENGIPTTLQRFAIVCLQTVKHFDSHRRIVGTSIFPMRRIGHCRHDEVCVNGLGPGNARAQGRQWANCVQKSVFEETMYGGNTQTRKDIQTVLDDQTKSAYMVMSDSDGLTPREADTFDICSWIDMFIDPDANMKEDKCKDCVNLKTNRFAPNIKAMKAEATLLTAGAAAGILWLGFMSG